MTSTEFAARYRLLKNVATRGARSFLAQQVELGRMVMVHYLDSETPQQRTATLARLAALRPPTRDKLLEIADVDGAPVAVTLFISSFVDFATWLDSVSPAMAAALSTDAALDAPTMIMAPVKPPRAAEPLPPPAPPAPISPPVAAAKPPAPPPSSEGSFTAIFGRLGDAPLSSADHSPPPMSPPSYASSPVMPPAAPSFRESPAAPLEVSSPGASQPGEFTQLFQRMAPAQGAPPAAPIPSFVSGRPAFGGMDVPRPIDVVPRVDEKQPAADSPSMLPPISLGAVPLSPPSLGSLPAPSLGALSFGAPSLGAAPSFTPPSLLPPPPNFGNAPAPNANGSAAAPAAPTPMWGGAALPGSLGSSLEPSAQSEFTRILGRVAVPPVPAMTIQPPSPSAAPAGAGKPGKSLAPLWVALGIVVLLTIAMVVYFVLHKG